MTFYLCQVLHSFLSQTAHLLFVPLSKYPRVCFHVLSVSTWESVCVLVYFLHAWLLSMCMLVYFWYLDFYVLVWAFEFLVCSCTALIKFLFDSWASACAAFFLKFLSFKSVCVCACTRARACFRVSCFPKASFCYYIFTCYDF